MDYTTIASIEDMDLLAFNDILIKHKDIIVRECSNNLRFKKMIAAKIERLKAISHLKPYYWQYNK